MRTKNKFRHEKVFIVDDDIIRSDVPNVDKELSNARVEILPGTLKVYA